MAIQLFQLIQQAAQRTPHAVALQHQDDTMTYQQLCAEVQQCAAALHGYGLRPNERVAVYLPKTLEAVVGMFAIAAAGAVFVPINPVLKGPQVQHILQDCQVRFLITTRNRAELLKPYLIDCIDLSLLILTDNNNAELQLPHPHIDWQALVQTVRSGHLPTRIDHDMAAILYTSGSTGKPKGVVLSHRNLLAGAESVANYLQLTPADRILAVLPLSFDYGLNQLTSAFQVGASVVLLDYLLAKDVCRAVEKYQITGLAAVPAMWLQLLAQSWTEQARHSLRYFTNSGGALAENTVQQLLALFPHASLYLMYGLTEAFRSTYLPPDDIQRHMTSMGKPIPNADVRVLRPDGTQCEPNEPGELVHRGALVALGYWNAPELTQKRFRPIAGIPNGLRAEMAVWSGDQVVCDEEGFFYFIGRKDDMIKTSGYRVSPSEIEEIFYQHPAVAEIVVFGVPHPSLGQGIVALYTLKQPCDADELLRWVKTQLPTFQVPQQLLLQDAIPRTANNKFDRSGLKQQYHSIFQESSRD